jgi:hypothetical protein
MVSINSLQELITYMTSQVASLTLVESFVFGGLRQVIEVERGANDFPLAVLAPPDVDFKGNNDSIQQNYLVKLMVVTDSDLLEATQFKDELQNMEAAAKQLIARFITDFSLRPELFSMDPIEGVTHDNLYGWQIEFPLQLWTTLCIDSELWQ